MADLKENDDEGFAHYLERFKIVNEALRAHGLPEHREPEDLDDIFVCDMYGYSGLHYLRRIAVHAAFGSALPSPGNSNNYHEDRLCLEYGNRFDAGENLKFSHLMIHSDAEGFYVPIDFERPIIHPSRPGEMLGSVQRLRVECLEFAGLIAMPMDVHFESEEIRHTIAERGHGEEKWRQYVIETYICVRLLSACEASLKHKAAITFC